MGVTGPPVASPGRRAPGNRPLIETEALRRVPRAVTLRHMITWIAALAFIQGDVPRPQAALIPVKVERIAPRVDSRIEALALDYGRSGDLAALRRGFAELIRRDLESGRIATRSDYEDRLQDLRAALEGVGRLSQEQSLRLNIPVERTTTIVSMLSGIMEKVSQTSDAVVSNIK